MTGASWMIADRGMGEPISLGAMLVAGKKPAPDATELLIQDHQTAFGYSDWYEGSRDPGVKQAVARRLCAALRAHQQIEEAILYPAAREATGDDALLDHAEEEHAEARKLVDQIEQMLERGELPDQPMLQLRTAVQKHVEEEEGTLFPKLRNSSLNLYALGAQIFARRLDLLWSLTGRASEGSELKESGKMPIDKDEAQGLFIAGLRDMHATASQAREMLERQIDRLENYPQVETRLREHLDEKNRQIGQLEEILDGLGESASGLKDFAMKAAGNISAMMSGATSDEIHKNSLALFGLTQFSVASYESLLVLGSAAGQTKAVKALQQCLSAERAMAAWLAGNLRGLVVMHLQRRSEGQRADR